MVIGIVGESCTGKSTLAARLKSLLGAEVCTGRDYLRLAKNEAIAKKPFQKKRKDAVSGRDDLDEVCFAIGNIPQGGV